MTTTTRATSPAEASAGPLPSLPRLLAGVQTDAPVALEEHLARYGGVPWQGPPRRGASRLITMIEESGLRGRGGGAFPTGRKLRTVAAGRGRPVVVANGTEGEPASFKDKLLLAATPHLVLDGAVLAAEAIGADEVVVAIDRAARASLRAVAHAIGTRQRARLDPVPFRLVETPSRYVAGEESALVAFVEGKPAQPTAVPPRPFERGVGGRPTLIQNVETLAHIALIARFGPSWFRELGTDDEPGSMLVTVSGAVAHPGVCEVGLGARLSDALGGAGGPTCDLSAVLVGGYYGSWLPADALDMPLTNAALRPRGAGLGCGVLYAFPAGRCGVAASARILHYLAGESAGQCGPCTFGLRAVADTIQKISDGRHDADDLQRLDRWLHEIPGRGACSYPDGVVRFATSALQVFSTEIARHGERGRCLSGDPPPMPLPDPRLAASGWR
jgi:NADH:ubiquinone oxidoreductase subunit F (NADH-binding)